MGILGHFFTFFVLAIYNKGNNRSTFKVQCHCIVTDFILCRMQSLEKENSQLRLESSQLRSEADRLRREKSSVEETLTEAQLSLQLLREENGQLTDRQRRSEEEREEGRLALEEMARELQELRATLMQGQANSNKRTSPLLTVHSIEDDDAVDGGAAR